MPPNPRSRGQLQTPAADDVLRSGNAKSNRRAARTTIRNPKSTTDQRVRGIDIFPIRFHTGKPMRMPRTAAVAIPRALSTASVSKNATAEKRVTPTPEARLAASLIRCRNSLYPYRGPPRHFVSPLIVFVPYLSEARFRSDKTAIACLVFRLAFGSLDATVLFRFRRPETARLGKSHREKSYMGNAEQNIE